MAVLALVAVLAVGCGDDGDDADDTNAGGQGTPVHDALAFTPVGAERLDAPLYLLPGDLEMAHEVAAAIISDSEGTASGPGSAVVLGVPTATGVRDLVLVGIEHGVDADREVSDSEQLELTMVDVNGVEARMSETPIGVTIDWWTDGRLVGLISATDDPDLALAVARSLDPDADGADMLTSVPEGLTLLAATTVDESPIVDGPAPVDWNVLLRIGAESVFINADVTAIDVVPLVFAATGGSELTTIDVRGVHGAYSTRTTEFGGSDDVPVETVETTTLIWLERPGFAVSVSGSTDLETLVAVAESLVEVSWAEMEQYTTVG